MSEIKFRPATSFRGYFAIFRDGHATCSCGRPLIRLSDKVYQCSAGYPIYHLDDGDILLDKFGTIYLREKSHQPANKSKTKAEKKAEKKRMEEQLKDTEEYYDRDQEIEDEDED